MESLSEGQIMLSYLGSQPHRSSLINAEIDYYYELTNQKLSWAVSERIKKLERDPRLVEAWRL